jgi:hypothetical protein
MVVACIRSLSLCHKKSFVFNIEKIEAIELFLAKCCEGASAHLHSIFKGFSRIVSIYNFVGLYEAMMGFQYLILGSNDTSYPTYMYP